MLSKTDRSNRWIFGTIAFFAVCTLLASFVLSYEKLHLLQDPNAKLSCSINLVLNCASVMKTPEASAFFGIPNTFFGLIGFSVALTLAVVLLVGVKLPRWMYVAMQIGFAAGWAFALWLFFSSVYVIQVLCPWCLVVTTGTTIMFAAMLRFNLRENNFGFNKTCQKLTEKALAKDADKVFFAGLLVLLVVLVFLKFGSGLFS